MARVYKRTDGSLKVCLGRDHDYSSFVCSSSGAIIGEGTRQVTVDHWFVCRQHGAFVVTLSDTPREWQLVYCRRCVRELEFPYELAVPVWCRCCGPNTKTWAPNMGLAD